VASILRTSVQIDFCTENTDFVPKGLQDSARGFNPGSDKQGGAHLSMCPGVETPGSVL
jgi:hypothetical protein